MLYFSDDQIFVFKAFAPLNATPENSSSKFANGNGEEAMAHDHDDNWTSQRITALFILLGRELLPVERVPCGRICAVEVNNGEWLGGQFSCKQKNISNSTFLQAHCSALVR
jgi:hypothetical protein